MGFLARIFSLFPLSSKYLPVTLAGVYFPLAALLRGRFIGDLTRRHERLLRSRARARAFVRDRSRLEAIRFASNS